MSSEIYGEIVRLRNSLSNLSRFNELEATVGARKKVHDETVGALETVRAQQESLKTRLADLPFERAKRKHTGEYWPALVIVFPWATLVLSTGFWAIVLKFSLFWSVCFTVPFTLVALILAIRFFYSRVESEIDADQVETEEKLHQLQLQLNTRQAEYDMRSKLYEAARNEYMIEANRLNELQHKLHQLESLVSAGLLGPENWRHLRGVEFEAYLKRVFESLGYQVEMTQASNDYGVDLIVSGNGIRYAIQAKGYDGAVSNSAVQEAHTGMSFYRCTQCVVITNSTFTRNAIELASRVGCRLVGEPEIDSLVRGEIFPSQRPSS